ncbi:MAG: reverse gyrase [Desulfurococcaceae archaeon]
MNAVIPVYRGSCPSCGGDVSGAEIEAGGVCSKCSTSDESPLMVLRGFLAETEGEFSDFFRRTTGLQPWGGQKFWLRKLLRGENAVLIAPTGLGKSTLLVSYAIYSAIKGKRVVYITPTKALLNQVREKVVGYLKNIGSSPDLALSYNSSYSKKKKLSILEEIQKCNFKLLIITNSFLARSGSLLACCKPDVVIVDDVDSLLRSEKGVLNLIRLLGYSERAVELSKRKANLLWRILVGKTIGKNSENLVKEYIELDRQLEAEISSTRSSQVVIASATGRARGLAGRVLRDLIRVDVSGISVYGRNVVDSYVLVDQGAPEISRRVLSIIKTLGSGCVIYISPHHPHKELYQRAVENVLPKLKAMNLKVAYAKPKTVSEFMEGRIDVIVGYSTYYGISVRGLDSPQHIKYAIFLGTPLFSVPLEVFIARLSMLTRVLSELSSISGNANFKKTAAEIRKRALSLSPSEKNLIKLCLIGRAPESVVESMPRIASLYREVKAVYSDVLKALKEILVGGRVLNVGSITLVSSGAKYLALIPDAMTYIQATGRTSRLIGNKMTRGLSVVVELSSLSNLVSGLDHKLKALSRDTSLAPIDTISLKHESENLLKSRGGGGGEVLEYRSILLVVESPTKAKTIARFFGKPSSARVGEVVVYTIPAKIESEIVEFNVVATRGHLFDLSINSEGLYGVLASGGTLFPLYTSIKRCKLCGHQFVDYESCPRCGSNAYSDTRYTVNVLRKLASEVDEVYIATDPDIEGEKIAYDVYISIQPFNQSVWRIKLHEISLNELLRALKSKQPINRALVEAEIYRRVLDRLLGFALSERLQSTYGLKFLGAGRVQTPVLGLIIDRYDLYLANRCKRVVITTSSPLEIRVSILLDKGNKDLLELIKGVKVVELVKLSEEVVEVSPRPPYTTDELLSDASKRGIPAELAMKLAQELFESGLITYHRTDCTHVSPAGISVARDYLTSRQLAEYFKPGAWGPPGAHEAIRPVYPLDSEGLFQAIEEGLVPVILPLTGAHFKLYDIIFRRFISSQMKPYKVIKSRFGVYCSGTQLGEVDIIVDIVENGFNLVLPTKTFPLLRGVKKVDLNVSAVEVVDSSKVPLYNDGDVILLMKELGIGRPSTYTKILKSLRSHGYIIPSKERNKLIPTKRGIEVYNYLAKSYPSLVSIEVTRRMEATIDKIAAGSASSFSAIWDVITNLADCGLIDKERLLVLPLNSNSYIGFEPASH